MIGLNMEFILSEETGYWTYAQAKDLGGLFDVVLKLEYGQNEMYSSQAWVDLEWVSIYA